VTSAALDLHLTDEERRLYEYTRTAAADRLGPIADAGTPGRVNRPLVEALATTGLLQRLFQRDGGRVSAIELCLIREALARECTEAETAFALQGLGAYPILQAATAAIQSEWIPHAVDAAVQVHGAKGLEHGHPLEHLYRDVRAPRIYEGASEIQREIISRRMFKAA
jgi:alkylation response protein AidB-like acyl-CoA dehydrogenase